MSTKKTSHVTMLRFLRVSIPLALMMFSLNVPTVFGAALCVTNPYGWPDNYVDQRCEVNLQVIPSSSTIPSGGSTDITLKALGILQYDVYLIDFSAWMVEDGTSVTTDLSYAGSEPEFAGSRIANTGALTKSVTVYLYGLNTQGKSKSVSAHITVTPSTSCVAGWSEEELTFDGTPNSGTGWCNNTSYGACASGTVTGSHDASVKGSVTACCRGAGTLGYLRNCGSPPPPSTVTPTSCGAYGGVNDAGTTGACRFNLNVGETPSGGSYTSTSIYSPSGYTGSYTWNCSNGTWSPGAYTCTPPSAAAYVPTCTNGGVDGATCCGNGYSNYPTCWATSCTNGASNYPDCNNICTNGYTNYPTCRTEDASCTNGASNYPTCDNICTNGYTNYPTCGPGSCTVDYSYPETRPEAIASHCAGKGIICPAGQQYVSSITCHSGTDASGHVDWSKYKDGNSCTDPNCTGCGCVPISGGACTGTLPPGTVAWNGTAPSSDTPYTYSATDGTCKFKCTSGTWNVTTNRCVSGTGGVCTPAADETQTNLACISIGYSSGTYTRTRTSSCPGPTYGNWTNNTTSCWTNYCTGGNDVNGNYWQIWAYDNSSPKNYKFVTYGTVANNCAPGVVPPTVYGCMDRTATNYKPLATSQTGITCTYGTGPAGGTPPGGGGGTPPGGGIPPGGVTPGGTPPGGSLPSGCGVGTLNDKCCVPGVGATRACLSPANNCGLTYEGVRTLGCSGTWGPCDETTAPPDIPVTATIKAIPNRVKSGGRTTLTLTATGINTCTLEKNNEVLQSLPVDSGTCTLLNPPQKVVDAVTDQSTYVITCHDQDGGNATATQKVNVDPNFYEF